MTTAVVHLNFGWTLNLLINITPAVSNVRCVSSQSKINGKQHRDTRTYRHGIMFLLQWTLVLLCLASISAQASHPISSQLRGMSQQDRGNNVTSSTDSSTSNSLKAVEHKQELFCRKMVEENGCRPGQGWGQMNKMQINRWKNVRCDKYFCQPNKMEARGSYRCEPVQGSGSGSGPLGAWIKSSVVVGDLQTLLN